MDQLCGKFDDISLANQNTPRAVGTQKTPRDLTTQNTPCTSGKKSLRRDSWVVSPSPSFIRRRIYDSNEDIEENTEMDTLMNKKEVENGVMEAIKEVNSALDGNDTEDNLNFYNCLKKMTATQKRVLLSQIEFNPSIVDFRITTSINAYLYGCTPLHAAASEGNLAGVNFLLEHGANVWKVDLQGKTALHHALANSHFEVAKEIEKKMRKKIRTPKKQINRRRSNKGSGLGIRRNSSDFSLPRPPSRSLFVNGSPSYLEQEDEINSSTQMLIDETQPMMGDKENLTEMEEEEDEIEEIRPLGEAAPVDLSNRTPLGLYCSEKKKIINKKNRNEEIDKQIETYFLKEGDHSIAPHIDPDNRIGGTPSLEFGYGHIPGWNAKMEDRILALSPLEVVDESNQAHSIGGTGWGIFAVFDGHGGAKASDFVAHHFLDCFLEAPSWQRFIENSEKPQEFRNDENSFPNFRNAYSNKEIFDVNIKTPYYDVELLKKALDEACKLVEDKLSDLPEFQTKSKKRYFMGQVDELKAAVDDSGTTACVALVTPYHIISANAGDSRMILVKEKLPKDNREAIIGDNSLGVRDQKLVPSLSPLYENSVHSKINDIKEVQYEALPLTIDDKSDDLDDWRRILNAGGCTLQEESILLNLFYKCKSYQELFLRVLRHDGDFTSDKYNKSEEELSTELEISGGYSEGLNSDLLRQFSNFPPLEEDLKRDIFERGGGDFANYIKSFTDVSMLLKSPSELETVEGHVWNRRVYVERIIRLGDEDCHPGFSLAMSRGLGDFRYKRISGLPLSEQLLIANPKIIVTERSKDDKYLFLASDGIYDVLENDQIASFLCDLDLGEEMCTTLSSSLSTYCDKVISKAMDEGTRDNLSTVLVNLNKPILSRKLNF